MYLSQNFRFLLVCMYYRTIWTSSFRVCKCSCKSVNMSKMSNVLKYSACSNQRDSFGVTCLLKRAFPVFMQQVNIAGGWSIRSISGAGMSLWIRASARCCKRKCTAWADIPTPTHTKPRPTWTSPAWLSGRRFSLQNITFLTSHHWKESNSPWAASEVEQEMQYVLQCTRSTVFCFPYLK